MLWQYVNDGKPKSIIVLVLGVISPLRRRQILAFYTLQYFLKHIQRPAEQLSIGKKKFHATIYSLLADISRVFGWMVKHRFHKKDARMLRSGAIVFPLSELGESRKNARRKTNLAQQAANGPVWMPQALKPLHLVLFFGWVNSLFSLLALWGNKNWPPSIKVKKL